MISFHDGTALCLYTLTKGDDNESLDPLRAKKAFKRKKLDHTMVSAIKASSVTL